MTQLEITLLVLVLLMSVPDLCGRVGRPALAYLIYIFVGVFCAPWLASGTRGVMAGVGEFGLILLLFVVGLEINLPRWRDVWVGVKMGWKALALLYSIFFLCVMASGFSPETAIIAVAALSACSMSLSYPAMKQMFGSPERCPSTLRVLMVLLEVQSMAVLVVGDALLVHGLGWRIILQLGFVLLALFVLAFFADHVTAGMRMIIERASHWRTHLLAGLILAICAVGDRMGLPAPKTAFFLGLFMGRTSGGGMAIEEHLAPIGRRMLIPLFFVGLGGRVDWSVMDPIVVLGAVCGGVFMLAAKVTLFRRVSGVTQYGAAGAAMLAPNLTIVAIGAEALYAHPSVVEAADWLLVSGLVMTSIAVLWLPNEGRRSLANDDIPNASGHK